jgi:polyferredoxin
MKKNYFIYAVVLVLSLIITFFAFKNTSVSESKVKAIVFSENMTLKELAVKNGIYLKEILHILSHEINNAWELPKNKPVKELNLDVSVVKHAVEHASEEKGDLSVVYSLIFSLIISGISLFYVLGKKKIYPKRLGVLIVVLLVSGFYFKAFPNPMESVVKIFKYFNSMESDIVYVFGIFAVFNLVLLLGSKFVCSFVCPLGALQEIIYSIIPSKKYKVPFMVSNAVRITFFMFFSIFLFGIGVQIKNFVMYHQFNFFKIFTWSLAPLALYLTVVFIIASVFTFRPFCHFICLFGLYSWVVQKITFNKINVLKDRCVSCQKCVKVCPTEAMDRILNEKNNAFSPSCWSCGKCIDVCPTDAIKYGNIDYKENK